MEDLTSVLRGRHLDNVLASQGLRDGESFADFWRRLRVERPDVAQEVTRLILQRLAEGDGSESQRQMLKEQAERDMGWPLPTAYQRYQEAKWEGAWGPDEAMTASGLPGEAGGFTLEAFKPRKRYSTVQEALEAVRAWLDDPRSAPLLTLAGKPGTGKTHLALAAGHALAQKACYVLYRTEGRLLAEVRRSFGPRGEDPLETLRDCTWLILDDVGVEASTDWGKGVVDQVVDQRWVSKRRLLVTTNATDPDELPARLASRLSDVGVGRVVVIEAPDYRRRRA